MASNATCPITGEVFKDPVICVGDGQTYERSAIVEWFRVHDTSPMTNAVLHNKTLITNYALRNLIEEVKDSSHLMDVDHLDAQSPKPQEMLKERSVLQSPRGRTGRKSLAKISSFVENTLVLSRVMNKKLVVSITAPDQQKHNPAHVICVMDVSGSMDELCCLGDRDNGFSRLDLVKHAMTTIIHSLTETDMISLVTFSTYATTVLDRLLMTDMNKEQALRRVKAINSDGSTNIWAGLKQAIDISCLTTDVNTSIILLTDGLPNTLNAQQVLQAFDAYPRLSTVPITTAGFGYQLDIDLLVNIAIKGFGSYLFVPDISMMGTVFVNYIANVLSKAETIVINGNITNIQFGQTKTMILPVSDSITLQNYHNSASYKFPIDTMDLEIAKNILIRHQFVDNLNTIVKQATTDPIRAKMLAMECYNNMTLSDIKQDLYSDELHAGQITKALDSETYAKWGKLYLPMLLRAHQRQLRCNFKDASVAEYGGSMFKHLSSTIDSLYSSLPAPVPSRKSHRTVVINNMASVNNVDNGCFEGDAEVIILHSEMDGILLYRTVKVKDVKPGDYLFSGVDGCFLQVKYVVKSTGTTMLCKDLETKALVTPWHPVLVNDEWKFPAELPHLFSNPERNENITVYNFVLFHTHVISVSGKQYVTLGHGIQEGAAKHEYFGTNAIIEDLERIEKTDGVIDITNFKFTRDPKSNLVNGLARMWFIRG